jgi:hypothetical protein
LSRKLPAPFEKVLYLAYNKAASQQHNTNKETKYYGNVLLAQLPGDSILPLQQKLSLLHRVRCKTLPSEAQQTALPF